MRRILLTAALAIAWACAPALADPVLITAPAQIGPMDTTIKSTGSNVPVPLKDAEITVQGAALTVNGAHEIKSLRLERNAANQPGVLTHTGGFSFDYGGDTGLVYGMSLLISTDLFVQGSESSLVASRIDADGRGFGSQTGPGAGGGSLSYGTCAAGGGYGGGGGWSITSFAGGSTYGSIQAPASFGSGGGRDYSSLGGAGGGAVRLRVLGAMTVDGAITSNGLPSGAGGSGGSVWISCGSLVGTGMITANGGGGYTGSEGGGGGGRIALYAGSTSMPPPRSVGGSGWSVGGAGTVYQVIGNGTPVLYIDNGGTTNANRETTELTQATTIDADVVVRGHGRLGPRRLQTSFDLTINGNLLIEPDGEVFADGRGFGSQSGPGAGAGSPSYGTNAAGGGYGGGGGWSITSFAGGSTYGSIQTPTDLGSGGGRDYSNLGGAGGGAIRLTVTGAMTVNGVVSSNGLSSGAGGSGGSLWITCGILSGTGAITANGGGGYTGSEGGGSGGRIALYTGSTSMPPPVCVGGTGWSVGGAGTVYQVIGNGTPVLYIDNGGTTNTNRETTEFIQPTTVHANVVVRGHGRLGPRRLQANFDLIIDGNLVVEPDGEVFADGRGYGSQTGPGAGAGSPSYGTNAAGGGYGGGGGWSSTSFAGGSTYGSIQTPTDLGSGGGRDYSNLGGSGGGAIRLTVTGAMTVNGVVSSNGLSSGAGGSGGSLWITCGVLSGTGAIIANGGGGYTGSEGGGGGGRIALYTGSTSMLPPKCLGGVGWSVGGAGTVYQVVGNNKPVLYIDNGGSTNTKRETTEIVQPTTISAHVIVRGHGRLGPRRLQTNFDLTIDGDLTVEPDGEVFADGRGYGSQTGPGAGAGSPSYGTNAAGGGYGGGGGWSSSSFAGGSTYGSIQSPTDLGSGGGRDYSDLGGAGGGAIRLHVSGAMTVNGVVSSNGLASGAGGSGGSLWITCGSLAGNGMIIANGGGGYTGSEGGGGGGRIALYAGSTSMPPPRSVGGSGWSVGGAGTVYQVIGNGTPVLYIDNGGTTNANRETTELTQATTIDADVVVRGHGRLGPRRLQTSFDLTINGNLLIEPDGEVFADGRGFGSQSGPGAGLGSPGYGTCPSGGGFGGDGGHSRSNCSNYPGGTSYGSNQAPVDLGSGGGRDYSTLGGAGGGAIRLTVSGTITINGTLSSNGQSSDAGGSGGSLWITCQTLEGTGTLSAAGGSGAANSGGGGGGGRIALYCCDIHMLLGQIRSAGGAGWQKGVDGTVYFGSSSINIFLQPPPETTYVGGDVVSLIVDASGDGPVTFQWYRENAPIVDGGRIGGAKTNQLTFNPIDCPDGGVFYCLVRDACGAFPTDPALVIVDAPSDYDHSGYVDTDDFTAFVADFELGIDAADFDRSGFVDTDDFTAFALAFEAGC